MKFINKLKNIWNTLKILLNSKSYIIYALSDNNILNKFEKDISNIDENTYVAIVDDVKTSLLNNICNGSTEIYSQKLDIYDPDLFNAYKELNYLDAKCQYIEADFMYYKDMNSTNNNITANTAYKLFERVQRLKNNYLQLEQDLSN